MMKAMVPYLRGQSRILIIPATKYFTKIISGGQTGVDRSALDVARELGLPLGGGCPKGRRAEDGPIDLTYPLQETESPYYPVRAEKNVLEWGRRYGIGTLNAAGPRESEAPGIYDQAARFLREILRAS
jgi:hypothetical protein